MTAVDPRARSVTEQQREKCGRQAVSLAMLSEFAKARELKDEALAEGRTVVRGQGRLSALLWAGRSSMG